MSFFNDFSYVWDTFTLWLDFVKDPTELNRDLFWTYISNKLDPSLLNKYKIYHIKGKFVFISK